MKRKRREEKRGKRERRKINLGKRRSRGSYISISREKKAQREKGKGGQAKRRTSRQGTSRHLVALGRDIERWSEWAQKCTDGEKRAFGQRERGPLEPSRGTGCRQGDPLAARKRKTKTTKKDQEAMHKTYVHSSLHKKIHRKVWVSTEDRETKARPMEAMRDITDSRLSLIRRRGWQAGKGARPTGKGMSAGQTTKELVGIPCLYPRV